MVDDPLIRPMIEADLPRLAEIRPGFTSDTVLHVEKTGSGLSVGWRLEERPLPRPYDKGRFYDFDEEEIGHIRRRFEAGDGFHRVVEWKGRLAGVLDVEPQHWNNTALVWNIMLDKAVRGQGLGRALFEAAAEWARTQRFRALEFETQTNNVPACRFYVRMGCALSGLRDTYYTNRDIQRNEVAIFWTYRL